LYLIPQGPQGTGDFAPRLRKSKYRDGRIPLDGRGFGRGLMQIDYDYHEFARTGNWPDPHENINYGCGLLARHKKQLVSRILLDESTLMRAVIASYNWRGAESHKSAQPQKRH